MTNEKLRQLVTAAVALDREIAAKTDLLKQMKESIATEAESRQEEATPTEGGGTSLTFDGLDGCIARVTSSAATLKSSIKSDDKKLPKIKEAACGAFTRLFETDIVYRPIADFRAQVASVLDARSAKALIKLCENPGRTTVAFETKEVTS